MVKERVRRKIKTKKVNKVKVSPSPEAPDTHPCPQKAAVIAIMFTVTVLGTVLLQTLVHGRQGSLHVPHEGPASLKRKIELITTRCFRV